MTTIVRITCGLMLAYSVIWMVIAMLIPLVLATTGWRLWRRSE